MSEFNTALAKVACWGFFMPVDNHKCAGTKLCKHEKPL